MEAESIQCQKYFRAAKNGEITMIFTRAKDDYEEKAKNTVVLLLFLLFTLLFICYFHSQVYYDYYHNHDHNHHYHYSLVISN
jgi:hypothetical protein